MRKGDSVIHPHHGEGVVTQISPEGKYAVVKYPTAQHGTESVYHRTHPISVLKIAVGVEEAPLECFVHGCMNKPAWVGRPPHFEHDVYVCDDERWRIQASERRRLDQEPQNDEHDGRV